MLKMSSAPICTQAIGSTQTITNGIDLADEGGMVWIKKLDRVQLTTHITDTERGAGKEIYTNQAWERKIITGTYGINSFNSDGFSLIGNNSPTNTNCLHLRLMDIPQESKVL
jgi:hypothetical protein